MTDANTNTAPCHVGLPSTCQAPCHTDSGFGTKENHLFDATYFVLSALVAFTENAEQFERSLDFRHNNVLRLQADHVTFEFVPTVVCEEQLGTLGKQQRIKVQTWQKLHTEGPNTKVVALVFVRTLATWALLAWNPQPLLDRNRTDVSDLRFPVLFLAPETLKVAYFTIDGFMYQECLMNLVKVREDYRCHVCGRVFTGGVQLPKCVECSKPLCGSVCSITHSITHSCS